MDWNKIKISQNKIKIGQNRIKINQYQIEKISNLYRIFWKSNYILFQDSKNKRLPSKQHCLCQFLYLYKCIYLLYTYNIYKYINLYLYIFIVYSDLC